MVWRLTKAGYQPSLKRQGADRGAEGGPRMGSVGQALLRANGNEQSGRLRRARHDDAATATRRKVDHRIDHRAGQKASQSGVAYGRAVLHLRWKMPLAQPKEAGPLCWQARGPGFESPMLHPVIGELKIGTHGRRVPELSAETDPLPANTQRLAQLARRRATRRILVPAGGAWVTSSPMRCASSTC